MTGYSTGAGNQLLSDGTWNYSYDAVGNTIEKTNISRKMVSVLFLSCLRFRKGVNWRPGWSKRPHDWDWSWCRVAVAVLVKRSKNELLLCSENNPLSEA